MKNSQNSINWLKVDGYKPNYNSSKCLDHNNLNWIKVETAEEKIKSAFVDVNKFFSALYTF